MGSREMKKTKTEDTYKDQSNDLHVRFL